jgi:hypothetical protein
MVKILLVTTGSDDHDTEQIGFKRSLGHLGQ